MYRAEREERLDLIVNASSAVLKSMELVQIGSRSPEADSGLNRSGG